MKKVRKVFAFRVVHIFRPIGGHKGILTIDNEIANKS